MSLDHTPFCLKNQGNDPIEMGYLSHQGGRNGCTQKALSRRRCAGRTSDTASALNSLAVTVIWNWRIVGQATGCAVTRFAYVELNLLHRSKTVSKPVGTKRLAKLGREKSRACRHFHGA
jgi:hypothetical protein